MTFAERLGGLRRTLHRALVRHLAASTRRPLLQLLTLQVVERGEVRTQAQLAERLLVDPPACSRIVAKLESDGLLTRSPGTDRRCVCLSVTPKGARVAAAFRDGLSWLDREVHKHASARELEAVGRVMARVETAVGRDEERRRATRSPRAAPRPRGRIRD